MHLFSRKKNVNVCQVFVNFTTFSPNFSGRSHVVVRHQRDLRHWW